MAVKFSKQIVVSDGTLSTIVLGINYIQQSSIYLRVAGVDVPKQGSPSGYTWSFITPTTIKILPVVTAGVEVEVYRRTDMDSMYNIYSQNAQFDEATIDENNLQLLYVAQEYLEQDLAGIGITSLEYVRAEPGYEIYRFLRSDGTYFPEFQVPTDTAALEAHKISQDQHTIAGVSGLNEALSVLASEDVALGYRIDTVSTDLASAKSRITALELRKSTCLVNATGTGAPHETVATQLPAKIAINSRYVLPNPFGNNTPVICWAEVFTNGKWSRTGFVYASAGGYGTDASYVQGEGVVVQTGNMQVCTDSIYAGGGHGTAAVVGPAPCRVFVRKLEV